MVLDESNAIKFINQKYYPAKLGGGLCIITIILIFILYSVGNYDLMISVAGIELLLYMLLNSVSGLIVSKLKPYFKQTVLVFCINFLMVFGLIYLLIGSHLLDYREYSPILEAFIFSFFGLFILVMLIRNIISLLKE